VTAEPPVDRTSLEDRVVAAAVELARERGWDRVRLHQIADRTGIPLPEIGARFRDVDAIGDVLFARARLHLLTLPPAEVLGLPVAARIAIALERWLDALAAERDVAAAILRARLWPAHVHHWVPMVFELSRLVHDVLDAGRVEGNGLRRAVQEVGVTAIVLRALVDWARDATPGQRRTRRRLRARLDCGGHAIGRLGLDRCAPRRPNGAGAAPGR
jgi:AcrR family transcriptional regulator